MKQTIIIIITILWAFAIYGQDSKVIKGIAVDKSGSPIPYCTVSVKGTKVAAQANQCGEFELVSGMEEFTIVFNCMATQDFMTFERKVAPREIINGEAIVFQLKKHGKTVNKDCKNSIDKRLKKLFV